MTDPRDDRKRREESNAQDPARARRRSRSAQDEPEEQLPDLSEHGGIEQTEQSPSQYHDRTRDRELKE